MKVKYEQRLNQKLELITEKTLVVGVDIAKHVQWARPAALPLGLPPSMINDRVGADRPQINICR